MFAGKVSDLTVLRSGRVADHSIGDAVRIEVAAGRGAAAVSRQLIGVDVVD